MKYVVIRQWKDNPDNYQILEYFSTIKDCDDYIKIQEKSHLFDLDIKTIKEG